MSRLITACVFIVVRFMCGAAHPTGGDARPGIRKRACNKNRLSRNYWRQSPNSVGVLLKLGALRLEDSSALHGDARTEALDEAQSYYERVTTIDSNNTAGLYGLGVIGWTAAGLPGECAPRQAQSAMEPETPGPLRDRNTCARHTEREVRAND